MNLGSRIANLRKKKKWTQQDLANRLFVTDKTISSWEANRTEPNLEILVKLSEKLNCATSYLIYGNNIKNDIETEIKIKITKSEFDFLKLYLEENANFLTETNQTDTYYQPTHRKFLKDNNDEITEWLRIGIRGNKKILNYKNWYDNKYCDEYEVEIDDEYNLEKIFIVLGLEKLVVVNKIRRTYFYQEKYEIALDYVENLGYFIEIEVKEYNKNAKEEYDSLLKVAKDLKLNLANIDKRGYPYHLIYEKEQSEN